VWWRTSLMAASIPSVPELPKKTRYPPPTLATRRSARERVGSWVKSEKQTWAKRSAWALTASKTLGWA
jgi:hypothetical protein